MWKIIITSITHQLPNNYRKKKLFIKKLHTQRTFLFFQNVSDVLKTCLQDVSQDFFKISLRSLQESTKTSWRWLQDVFARCLLQYVFKAYSRELQEDVLKTFWKTKKCHSENIFKTSSRRPHQDECLPGYKKKNYIGINSKYPKKTGLTYNMLI